jgi:hypothetical protein
MTFNTHPFEVSRQTADLEAKPVGNLYDEHDLDSNSIDASMVSPASTERKNSFASSSTAFFSPQTGTNPWAQDQYLPSATSSHPERHLSIPSQFEEVVIGSNNPYHPHHQAYTGPWAFDRSDSKTPMSASTYEPFATYDASTSINTVPGYDGAMPMFSVRPAAIMPPTGGVTPLDTSPPPQSGMDFMAMVEQDMDTGRLPKRVRQNSPQRSMTPGMASRRDGVRKKNARFDIPEGRNINNIDDLINQANTEEEVKDLKQQKRLLRNRQAAYAPSRMIWFSRTGLSYLVPPIQDLLTFL